jgi:hypothetical protein
MTWFEAYYAFKLTFELVFLAIVLLFVLVWAAVKAWDAWFGKGRRRKYRY